MAIYDQYKQLKEKVTPKQSKAVGEKLAAMKPEEQEYYKFKFGKDWRKIMIQSIEKTIDESIDLEGYLTEMHGMHPAVHGDHIGRMQPKDIKAHFKDLYNKHLKTGMAPKVFKSPFHLAQTLEKSHKVPQGTYTRHMIGEDLDYIEEDAGNGYRIKKHKDISMVFRGDKHVGNIHNPKDTDVGQYKAVSKHWGLKKDHNNDKDALNWLISVNNVGTPAGTALANSYTPEGKLIEGEVIPFGKKLDKTPSKKPNDVTKVLPFRSKDTKRNMLTKLRLKKVASEEVVNEYETSTHEYEHHQNKKATAQLVKHEFSNGDQEYSTHVHGVKLAGAAMVRHSTQAKAHKRLIGLGFKHTGETTREETENRAKLSIVNKFAEELEDKNKRDKEAINQKVANKDAGKKPDDCEAAFQHKKTETGEEGDIIKINPKLNRPKKDEKDGKKDKSQPTFIKPETKKAPE